MKKLPVYLSVILSLFFAENLYSQKFVNNIDEVRKNLIHLADDRMKGRETGSAEDRKSAEFIAETLSDYGFKPLVGENPLVPFNLTFYREVGYGSHLIAGNIKYIEWKDYKVLPQSPSFSLNGVCTYPSGNPEKHPNPVLIIKTSQDSIPLLAAMFKSRGISALLVNTGEPISDSRIGGTTALSIPVLQISDEVYSDLITKSGKYVDIKTVTNAVQGDSYNVLMSYGKEDAPLTVIVGAHFDHLGMGGAGSGSMKPKEMAVHNGADDNASGVAGAMEIGRLLSAYADSLGLRIIVGAFGAEERGLIGSRAAADTLNKLGTLPDLMINLDMVGRLSENKLQIGGVGTFAQAADIVKKANEGRDFVLTLINDGYGPSDHSSFYTVGVPVLYLTTGVHKQYHTPDDDIELINFDGIGSISEYVASVITIISSSEAPKYIKTESPPTMSRAAFKVTLGVIPDFTYEKGDGFRVGSVSDAKPADKAGMKAGDIIKKMNNKPVLNIYEYMAMLGELKKGEKLIVEIERDGDLIKLEIQL